MPCTCEASVLLLNHMASLSLVLQTQPVKRQPQQVRKQDGVQQ